MDFTNDITKIKDLVDKAHDVLVVTHEHPTHDTWEVYCTLFRLNDARESHNCCPDPILVELSSFIGATVKAVWGRKILLYL